MTTTPEQSARPFRGAAPYYVQGRLPYAAGLADALARELGLDGHGRLLDVGCGPGVVALRLAHLFDEVVGVDIDPDMLAEAARRAEEEGVTGSLDPGAGRRAADGARTVPRRDLRAVVPLDGSRASPCATSTRRRHLRSSRLSSDAAAAAPGRSRRSSSCW
jgi:SAM-dependent methyltransferase